MRIADEDGIIVISHNEKCLQLTPKELDLLRKFVVTPAKLEIEVWETIFPKSKKINKRKTESHVANRESLTEILKDPNQLREAIAKFDDATRNTHDGSCDTDIEQ